MLQVATVLTALTALTASAASAALAQQLRVPHTIDTLANGLTLIVHEDASAPVASVNVWYHVGSGDEKVGRAGFAHLFEHLMFTGSEHAPYPQFDRLLEAAGANNNGSTSNDRTNYYESGPSNAVPLMLWLEADRMGWLAMDTAKLDLQRDVVKNERRENYENQPYGLVWDHLPRMMYPAGHPYSWPPIGSMADLSAASLEDVQQFFRAWYAPNNATIVVAGRVKAPEVKALVRAYFDGVPRGPAITRNAPAPVSLPRDTLLVLEDKVQLPRLYLSWHTVKAWGEDDAALQVAAYVLSGARNSRLDAELLYAKEIASSVTAYQNGLRFAGSFAVVTTALPSHDLDEVQDVIDAELRRLAQDGPTPREIETARNALEARFLNGIERLENKAEQLNRYYYAIGTPDAFQPDLDRLRAVTARDVQRVTSQYLLGPRASISVVPKGNGELAAGEKKATP
jgi:zinc protease